LGASEVEDWREEVMAFIVVVVGMSLFLSSY
jgi:hypothetical protein